MTPGIVYWFTGLSGVGKSTLAAEFHKRLSAGPRTAVFLDGDTLREVFGNDLGHTRADRLKSAMRNARLCKFLSEQGLDVVCATISLFHECQDWNRRHIAGYREIYVEASLDVLKARDPKKIYAKASAGEMTDVAGVHFTVETPKSPDIRITNDGSDTPLKVVDGLWAQLFPSPKARAAGQGRS